MDRLRILFMQVEVILAVSDVHKHCAWLSLINDRGTDTAPRASHNGRSTPASFQQAKAAHKRLCAKLALVLAVVAAGFAIAFLLAVAADMHATARLFHQPMETALAQALGAAVFQVSGCKFQSLVSALRRSFS
jgi:hypothetical protein